MQQSHKQQQRELQALQEELQTVKQQRDEEDDEERQQDRDALNLVTQQAARAEQSSTQLAERLQEKVRVRQSQRFLCHRVTKDVMEVVCGK